MNHIELAIRDNPPSNNRYLGKTGSNWAYSREKKKWACLISEELKGKIPETPFEKAVVHIHYIFPDNRKRDPDNYSGKMILDPLVANRVIQDDSFKCIKLELSAEVISHQKETHIEVRPIEKPQKRQRKSGKEGMAVTISGASR